MPFPDKNSARNTILALFKTAWDAQTPPVPQLHYDNVKKDVPKDAAAYARIQVIHNTGFQATLSGENGNKRFTHAGLVTVQIFSKYGEGLTQSDAFAQVAIEAFQGKRTGPDQVFFKEVRSVEVGVDGDWYQTNVIAEFQYDSIK